MIAIFYDRKNGHIVRSDQLVPTDVIAEVLQGDSQEGSMLTEPISALLERDDIVGEDEDGNEIVEGAAAPGRLQWHTIQVGVLGYRSPHCPPHMNYDFSCLQSDLVFLEVA